MSWEKHLTKMCKKCPLHLKICASAPWEIWSDRLSRQRSTYMYILINYWILPKRLVVIISKIVKRVALRRGTGAVINKNIGGHSPTKSRRRTRETRGAEASAWSGVWEGCPLSSWLVSLGSVMSSPGGGPERSPSRERILEYFEGHRTLLFAPVCRCFKFVKQCFMSQIWGKAEVWGIAPCRNATASRGNKPKNFLTRI